MQMYAFQSSSIAIKAFTQSQLASNAIFCACLPYTTHLRVHLSPLSIINDASDLYMSVYVHVSVAIIQSAQSAGLWRGRRSDRSEWSSSESPCSSGTSSRHGRQLSATPRRSVTSCAGWQCSLLSDEKCPRCKLGKTARSMTQLEHRLMMIMEQMIRHCNWGADTDMGQVHCRVSNTPGNPGNLPE